MGISNSFCNRVLVAGLLWLGLSAADTNSISRLQKEGAALSETDVEKLEKKVEGKPKNQEDRVRLLSFYSYHSTEPDSARFREKRNALVLWIIRQGSLSDMMLASSCQLLIYPTIGAYAGAKDADLALNAWTQRTVSEPANIRATHGLASQMALSRPQKAFDLMAQSGVPHEAGRLAAQWLLGITHYNLKNCEPAGVRVRQPTAALQSAFADFEKNDSALFVGSFGSSLAELGESLYRSNVIDWNYTTMANALRKRAIAAMPEEKENYSEEYLLPPREPKGTGNPDSADVPSSMQQAKLLTQARPTYPASARANRTEGRVRFDAIIGSSGKIIWLGVIDGQDPFIASAVAAVKQWTYSPTKVNGIAHFVKTTIDVNYALSSR